MKADRDTITKMKVTLIQIDLVMGSRILLSILKEKGYDAKSLQVNVKYTDVLKKADLEAIFRYTGGSAVAGLSFNSFYAPLARQIALYLKNKGIKYIIAGGTHATALPDEVMEYADVVVRYEAELTFPRVLESLDDADAMGHIKGIIFRKNGQLVHTDGAPEIIWDLDKLSFQSIDTSLMKYFDLKRKVYTPERRDLFPGARGCYFILASRGCPFSCTYCSNSLYHSISPRFRKVRKRSVENILSEMAWAVRNGFKSFYIADDSFFSFSTIELEAFGRGYKRNIKRPFSVVGLNPKVLATPEAEKKLKTLLDCGLSDVRIGVQSGSDNTLKVFGRGYTAADVPKMLEVIERNRKTIWGAPYDTLHVALDFICDAAWETEEDKIATIWLAQRLLRQYSIFFYTLVYLPGTTIYHMAREKGWVSSHEKDIYLRGIAGVDDNIYNRILFLIAVAKERGVTLKDVLIDHLVNLSVSDEPRAKEIVSSMIECINGVEAHHKVNLVHAAIHPYLTGFNEWTKTKGDVGRKVLFRSYHQPYG